MRPNYSCSTLALRWHQALVLLGFRPSVASILRSTLIPLARPANSIPTPLANLVNSIAQTPTPACYLIFCDSSQTFVIEKDLNTGKIRSSEEFIVHTNNDEPTPEHKPSKSQKNNWFLCDFQYILEESGRRKACMEGKWVALKKRHVRNQQEGKLVVKEETLKDWVRQYPVMNEESHFACLMDPRYGEIRWLERGCVEAKKEYEAKMMDLALQ